MRWAEPDVAHAIELLRAAYREQTLTRARAQAGAVRIRERFSLERVGADARDRLIILRDARRSGRQLSLRSTVPAPVGHLATPPIPVPPSWYDADYFEHGVKSNWTRGYHWSLFAGLFRATATLLCELFPHNESFLDAGCAKGFLIRALIERGRDCTGFDHSRWAVDHAERMAAPHIACVGAAEYTFPRPVDVLLAFDLLSHLTEDEAEAFLRRARAHVSRSLFATLPSERVSASDRDRTHVNRRDRAWWSALLARTGWRHDAASDALEYSSQQHALTQRMDWIVIVASPGAAVEAERFQASVDQVGVA
jgi:2-polyprenyl-3-methyl-5-hydroxy-6-metoxy-1,4-benzoquinol methylase